MSVTLDEVEVAMDSVRGVIDAQRQAHTALEAATVAYEKVQDDTQEALKALRDVLSKVE